MSKRILGAVAGAMLTAAVPAAEAAGTAEQSIVRAGTTPPFAGPVETFTGQVKVLPVYAATDTINTSGGLVTFQPGARSAWHTHPAGQYLYVTEGEGLTQEWGKPVQVLRAGDVVWCPPGVKHWHGAATKSSMSHLAITGTVDGKNVNWLEKVSDEQYGSR